MEMKILLSDTVSMLFILLYLPLIVIALLYILIHDYNQDYPTMNSDKILYIFLDLDGVLNNKATYEAYQQIFEEHEEWRKLFKRKESRRKLMRRLMKWNKVQPRVLLFKDIFGCGEIVDRQLIDAFSSFFHGLGYKSVKVILTSSASRILDGNDKYWNLPHRLSYQYYSRLIKMKITDIIPTTVGDSNIRYRFMVDWLYRRHFNHTNERFHAIMLDDLPSPKMNNLGYYEVQHYRTPLSDLLSEIKINLEEERNVLTHKNIVDEWL